MDSCIDTGGNDDDGKIGLLVSNKMKEFGNHRAHIRICVLYTVTAHSMHAKMKWNEMSHQRAD